MPIDDARAVLDRLGLAYDRGWDAGRLMKEVYDEKVQHDVVGPVFCIDYPREVSPLARAHRDDPDYVERFELIVAGFELCNAYSEQNDPVEQLAAFEAEARAKAGGDPEAGDVDHDYIRALEQGMPCTGGLGIGIDRLVMLLASVDSIREVILFPTLRPEFTPPDGGPGRAPATARTHSGSACTAEPRRRRRGARPVGRRAARHRAVRPHDSGPGGRPGPRPRHHPRPGRTDRRRRAAAAAHPSARGALPDGPAGNRPRPAVGTGGRARRLRRGRPAAARARRPAAQAQMARLARGHRTVRGRCRRARPQGAPPGRAGLLRRHARGTRLVPPRLQCTGRPTVAAAPGPVHPDVPRRRARVRYRDAVDRAGPRQPGPLPRRGPADGRGRPGRHRRALHLPVAVLRRVLPRGAGRAGHRRRDRAGRAPVPAARGPASAHRRRLGARHPPRPHLRLGHPRLLRVARRQESSFARDGEAFLAYTYIGGYALVAGYPIGRRESVIAVLDEFLAMCDERAWTPALLAVREASMPLYGSRRVLRVLPRR